MMVKEITRPNSLRRGLHGRARMTKQLIRLHRILAREEKAAIKSWLPHLEAALVKFGKTIAKRFTDVAIRRGAKVFIAGQMKNAYPNADWDLIAGEALQIAWAAGDKGVLLASYGGQYLSVAKSTFDALDNVMSLGVNMSDYMQSAIYKTAGRRLGLLDLETATKDTMFSVLEEARAEGLGADAMARRLAQEIPRGRYLDPRTRAEVIARTETKYAQNYSSLEAYRSGDITDVMVFDAQLGPTDEECEAINGETVSLEEAMALMESEHPNGTRSFAPVVR